MTPSDGSPIVDNYRCSQSQDRALLGRRPKPVAQVNLPQVYRSSVQSRLSMLVPRDSFRLSKKERRGSEVLYTQFAPYTAHDM